MTLEATINASSLASHRHRLPISPSNNPRPVVVSVAREDAAEPYITNFWPDDICSAVVTSATSAAPISDHAATEVFAARGFTAATMADIVDYSGASIGSIYH